MVRRLALIALLAGVAVGGTVDARTTRDVKAEAKSQKKKKKKTKKKKRSAKKLSKSKAKRVTKRSKRRKKPKKVPRIPDRTTDYAKNMPRGFAWPPTKAMKEASARCEQELALLGIEWKRAKPEKEARIVDPIVVPSMELGGIKYRSKWRRGPHPLDCQFARTLAILGDQLHALGIREVTFGSIYRNTTVRVGGKSKNILSRHALGIAMDVVSVVDDTGREIVVEDDYKNDDPVLLGLEEAINESGQFRTVLTPRNDPTSHHDHFHIEAIVDYSAPDAPGR